MNLFSDKNIYALHKWFGLISGLFLLLLSVTGIILLYDESLDRMFNPALTQVTAAEQRLPVDSLLSVTKKQFPKLEIGGVLLQTNDPSYATITDASAGKKRMQILQNPYTGLVLGSRLGDQTIHRQILKIHEHLTIGPVGHLILFIVGICFMGLVVTGLWYYRRSLFTVFKIGVRGGNNLVFNADLHKLTGISIFLFLLLIGFTGTFMHWEKVERFLGGEERRPEGGKPEAKAKPADLPAPAPTPASFSIESLVQKTPSLVPGFVPCFVALPRGGDDPIAIRGTRPESNPLLGKFNTEIQFDAKTGELKGIEHKEDAEFEASVEAGIEQIHFGKYGGWISRLIYALGSLGLAIMGFTGYVIWWNKRK
jgi:uncharacterized iron-regulated membrane protein